MTREEIYLLIFCNLWSHTKMDELCTSYAYSLLLLSSYLTTWCLFSIRTETCSSVAINSDGLPETSMRCLKWYYKTRRWQTLNWLILLGLPDLEDETDILSRKFSNYHSKLLISPEEWKSVKSVTPVLTSCIAT